MSASDKKVFPSTSVMQSTPRIVVSQPQASASGSKPQSYKIYVLPPSQLNSLGLIAKHENGKVILAQKLPDGTLHQGKTVKNHGSISISLAKSPGVKVLGEETSHLRVSPSASHASGGTVQGTPIRELHIKSQIAQNQLVKLESASSGSSRPLYARRASSRRLLPQFSKHWKSSLEEVGYIRCPLRGCNFICLTFGEMTIHYYQCKGEPYASSFTCTPCNGRLRSEEELKRHMILTHSRESKLMKKRKPEDVVPKQEEKAQVWIRKRAYSKVHKISWNISLGDKGYVNCFFKNCCFMALDLQQMIQHYGICNGTTSATAVACPCCEACAESLEKLKAHIEKSHSQQCFSGVEVISVPGSETSQGTSVVNVSRVEDRVPQAVPSVSRPVQRRPLLSKSTPIRSVAPVHKTVQTVLSMPRSYTALESSREESVSYVQPSASSVSVATNSDSQVHCLFSMYDDEEEIVVDRDFAVDHATSRSAFTGKHVTSSASQCKTYGKGKQRLPSIQTISRRNTNNSNRCPDVTDIQIAPLSASEAGKNLIEANPDGESVVKKLHEYLLSVEAKKAPNKDKQQGTSLTSASQANIELQNVKQEQISTSEYEIFSDGAEMEYPQEYSSFETNKKIDNGEINLRQNEIEVTNITSEETLLLDPCQTGVSYTEEAEFIIPEILDTPLPVTSKSTTSYMSKDRSSLVRSRKQDTQRGNRTQQSNRASGSTPVPLQPVQQQLEQLQVREAGDCNKEENVGIFMDVEVASQIIEEQRAPFEKRNTSDLKLNVTETDLLPIQVSADRSLRAPTAKSKPRKFGGVSRKRDGCPPQEIHIQITPDKCLSERAKLSVEVVQESIKSIELSDNKEPEVLLVNAVKGNETIEKFADVSNEAQRGEQTNLGKAQEGTKEFVISHGSTAGECNVITMEISLAQPENKSLGEINKYDAPECFVSSLDDVQVFASEQLVSKEESSKIYGAAEVVAIQEQTDVIEKQKLDPQQVNDSIQVECDITMPPHTLLTNETIKNDSVSVVAKSINEDHVTIVKQKVPRSFVKQNIGHEEDVVYDPVSTVARRDEIKEKKQIESSKTRKVFRVISFQKERNSSPKDATESNGGNSLAQNKVSPEQKTEGSSVKKTEEASEPENVTVVVDVHNKVINDVLREVTTEMVRTEDEADAVSESTTLQPELIQLSEKDDKKEGADSVSASVMLEPELIQHDSILTSESQTTNDIHIFTQAEPEYFQDDDMNGLSNLHQLAEECARKQQPILANLKTPDTIAEVVTMVKVELSRKEAEGLNVPLMEVDDVPATADPARAQDLPTNIITQVQETSEMCSKIVTEEQKGNKIEIPTTLLQETIGKNFREVSDEPQIGGQLSAEEPLIMLDATKCSENTIKATPDETMEIEKESGEKGKDTETDELITKQQIISSQEHMEKVENEKCTQAMSDLSENAEQKKITADRTYSGSGTYLENTEQVDNTTIRHTAGVEEMFKEAVEDCKDLELNDQISNTSNEKVKVHDTGLESSSDIQELFSEACRKEAEVPVEANVVCKVSDQMEQREEKEKEPAEVVLMYEGKEQVEKFADSCFPLVRDVEEQSQEIQPQSPHGKAKRNEIELCMIGEITEQQTLVDSKKVAEMGSEVPENLQTEPEEVFGKVLEVIEESDSLIEKIASLQATVEEQTLVDGKKVAEIELEVPENLLVEPKEVCGKMTEVIEESDSRMEETARPPATVEDQMLVLDKKDAEIISEVNENLQVEAQDALGKVSEAIEESDSRIEETVRLQATVEDQTLVVGRKVAEIGSAGTENLLVEPQEACGKVAEVIEKSDSWTGKTARPQAAAEEQSLVAFKKVVEVGSEVTGNLQVELQEVCGKVMEVIEESDLQMEETARNEQPLAIQDTTMIVEDAQNKVEGHEQNRLCLQKELGGKESGTSDYIMQIEKAVEQVDVEEMNLKDESDTTKGVHPQDLCEVGNVLMVGAKEVVSDENALRQAVEKSCAGKFSSPGNEQVQEAQLEESPLTGTDKMKSGEQREDDVGEQTVLFNKTVEEMQRSTDIEDQIKQHQPQETCREEAEGKIELEMQAEQTSVNLTSLTQDAVDNDTDLIKQAEVREESMENEPFVKLTEERTDLEIEVLGIEEKKSIELEEMGNKLSQIKIRSKTEELPTDVTERPADSCLKGKEGKMDLEMELPRVDETPKELEEMGKSITEIEVPSKPQESLTNVIEKPTDSEPCMKILEEKMDPEIKVLRTEDENATKLEEMGSNLLEIKPVSTILIPTTNVIERSDESVSSVEVREEKLDHEMEVSRTEEREITKLEEMGNNLPEINSHPPTNISERPTLVSVHVIPQQKAVEVQGDVLKIDMEQQLRLTARPLIGKMERPSSYDSVALPPLKKRRVLLETSEITKTENAECDLSKRKQAEDCGDVFPESLLTSKQIQPENIIQPRVEGGINPSLLRSLDTVINPVMLEDETQLVPEITRKSGGSSEIGAHKIESQDPLKISFKGIIHHKKRKLEEEKVGATQLLEEGENLVEVLPELSAESPTPAESSGRRTRKRRKVEGSTDIPEERPSSRLRSRRTKLYLEDGSSNSSIGSEGDMLELKPTRRRRTAKSKLSSTLTDESSTSSEAFVGIGIAKSDGDSKVQLLSSGVVEGAESCQIEKTAPLDPELSVASEDSFMSRTDVSSEADGPLGRIDIDDSASSTMGSLQGEDVLEDEIYGDNAESGDLGEESATRGKKRPRGGRRKGRRKARKTTRRRCLPQVEVSQEEPDPAWAAEEVQCGKCSEKMTRRAYQHHNIAKHNGLAWLEGEPPFDMNNEKILLSTLWRVVKNHKQCLQCEKCGTVKKSAVGFASHLEFCQRSAEEREALLVKCEICLRYMKPASLKVHMGIHKTDESKKQKLEELQVSLTVGKTKRAAAAKATLLMQEFIKEEVVAEAKKAKDETSIFYKRLGSSRPAVSITCKWKKSLASEGIAQCNFPGCTFTSSELPVLTDHYMHCNKAPKKAFRCEICDYESKDENQIKSHVQSVHVEQREDSDTENNTIKKIVPKNFCWKTCNKLLFLAREMTGPIHGDRPYTPAAKWTLQFCEENYSSSDMFPGYHTSKTDWIPVLDECVEDYIPETKESIPFATVQMARDVIDVQSVDLKWKKMGIFESSIIEDEPLFFTGGPVWALAWSPMPVEESMKKNADQFLAVCCHQKMDSVFYSNERYEGKGLIQLWNFGPLDNLEKIQTPPKFALGIAHDFGIIWDLEWCPSGSYDNDECNNRDKCYRRIGLLAGAFSDGCIHVFSVCFPNQLEGSGRYPIYKCQPVMTLVLDENPVNLLGDIPWSCLRLSWYKGKNHSIIGGAFSNGIVGLWDIRTTSPLLKKKWKRTEVLLPYHTFQAHLSAVTALSLAPQDEGRFLVTGSVDCTVKLWDMEDTTGPIPPVIRKGMVTDGEWLTHWLASVTSYDDVYSMAHCNSTLNPPRGFGFKVYPILAQNSVAWSLSGCDWINGIAQGTQAGELTAIFPHQLILGIDTEKGMKDKRMVLSYVELKDFADKSDEHVCSSLCSVPCQKVKSAQRKEAETLNTIEETQSSETCDSSVEDSCDVNTDNSEQSGISFILERNPRQGKRCVVELYSEDTSENLSVAENNEKGDEGNLVDTSAESTKTSLNWLSYLDDYEKKLILGFKKDLERLNVSSKLKVTFPYHNNEKKKTNSNDTVKEYLMVVSAVKDDEAAGEVVLGSETSSVSNKDDLECARTLKVYSNNYETISRKFGMVFCNFPTAEMSDMPAESRIWMRRSETMRTSSIEMYPITSLNKVQWNPNARSFLWLASGYQSGLVRVPCVSGMHSRDVENILSPENGSTSPATEKV